MGGLLESPCGGSFSYLPESPIWNALLSLSMPATYSCRVPSSSAAGNWRGESDLDHNALTAKLETFAEAAPRLPFLRIHWFDGTSQGPTPQHITLAGLANVKVRLGFVNSQGQQKGVDSLIVTDMITLARNRAMAGCVLLSGDEDLRVGVHQAQEYGARVHLPGIKAARGSQSLFLLQEADVTHEWEASDLGSFLRCNPHPRSGPPSPGAAVTPGHQEVPDRLEEVARQVAENAAKTEIAALVESIRKTNLRPRQVDAKLLGMSRSVIGNDLDSSQKSKVRAAFLSALEARLNESRLDTGRSIDSG